MESESSASFLLLVQRYLKIRLPSSLGVGAEKPLVTDQNLLKEKEKACEVVAHHKGLQSTSQ